MTKARVFDDILDGYFPLGSSLSQCLERNGFASALIVMTHAPVLDLADRPGTAPVPLRLAQHSAGLIRRLMVMVTADGAERTFQGTGAWRWHQGAADRPLTPQVRLAEPAFVRGIGFEETPKATCFCVDLEGATQLWGFASDAPGFAPLSGSPAPDIFVGEAADTRSDCARIQPSNTQSLGALARDWSL